jgi:hypothetical protein
VTCFFNEELEDMPNIFITYRRVDSSATSELLHHRIAAAFPRSRVFIDIQDVPAGTDWRRLSKRVSNYDVVLVVIGPMWLPTLQECMADEAVDFVRLEVSEALRQNKRVIPILVDGAQLPAADELPPDIAALASLQSMPLRRDTREGDIGAIAAALQGRGVLVTIAASLRGRGVLDSIGKDIESPQGRRIETSRAEDSRQKPSSRDAPHHIERTVFISYRRSNVPWALAIFQNLTQRGYDVFFDFEGIGSGDFERVILENITTRAHFLILLTPSALERCDEPDDPLRREIETALDSRRNIIPLMLEGFDFRTPAIANRLTGKLATLKRYNALNVPADFFSEAMERLSTKHLNVPLPSVLHPIPKAAQRVVKDDQAAARAAPVVEKSELVAQQSFEQNFNAANPREN